MYVTHDQILQARSADLHSFLLARHPDVFARSGCSIYLKANHSLYIKEGFYGYHDFANGETGNGIDFLTRHMGYSFQEAVSALCGGKSPGRPDAPPGLAQTPKRPFQAPQPAAPPYIRLFAYLRKRGIPDGIIRMLVREALVYQEEGTNNIVFISREQDYCELRGTYTFTKKQFHGCRKTSADRFWYLKRDPGMAAAVYITEAAIDAISLYLIHLASNNAYGNVYVSIGGVSNDAAISRIKRHSHAILAVDNDEAGSLCRKRHKDLNAIMPYHKDWNEDLLAKDYLK